MISLWQRYAHPIRLQGSLLEAPLADVAIGELCQLRGSLETTEIVGRAQVVGFHGERALLSVLGNTSGLSRRAVVIPTGSSLQIEVGTPLLGCVLDASGSVVEVLSQPQEGAMTMSPVFSSAPMYAERSSVDTVMDTGIRAIDGLLTCGIGQRVGIFASAGCGKTSLMNMLIEHASADVFVVGLIGERGREVGEFTEWLRNSKHRDRTVLVYATSDDSAVDRCNAANVATTVAEHFRDQGKNVLLVVDSLTRFARASRDVALSAGEMPARRGYPASVFEALPKLLERAGKTKKGSITAFYTVLLESEDEADPIGEEIRSLLDGHIYLSGKLAGQGHFPAIDILRSVSRLFGQITDAKHKTLASRVRQVLSKLEEMQIYVDLGEYQPGKNSENDRAFASKPALMKLLQQDLLEATSINATLEKMHAAIAKN